MLNTPWALALLALAALTPLALALRRQATARGRREAALSLHRAQLGELDRDLAEGRIAPAEHETARLEVQRRLLAAAEAGETGPARASRAPLIAALVVVPLAGTALYLLQGHPGLPAAPLAELRSRAEQRAAEEARLIGLLRQRLAQLDQHSDQARQGYVLLGNVEDSRGNMAAAASAWRTAVGIRFDATLAAQAAEAQTQVDGHVSPDSAALFRQALAAAPQDAPWRPLVEDRLKDAP